jgi:hypothetical protein
MGVLTAVDDAMLMEMGYRVSQFTAGIAEDRGDHDIVTVDCEMANTRSNEIENKALMAPVRPRHEEGVETGNDAWMLVKAVFAEVRRRCELIVGSFRLQDLNGH